jgi:ribosomal protein L6P/L9E
MNNTNTNAAMTNEKQTSAFGTYRTSQCNRMANGVKKAFGIDLTIEVSTYDADFASLSYVGRMGLNRWEVINAFIKGINYADWN